MYAITVNQILNNYSNAGQNKQQNADYMLTGKRRHADHGKWDITSDIPELNMSIKSDRFSLCGGGELHGDTFEEMVADFNHRVASEKFLYITNEWMGFVMDKAEFIEFISTFCKVTRDSRANKAGKKIKLHHESQKVRDWLVSRAEGWGHKALSPIGKEKRI